MSRSVEVDGEEDEEEEVPVASDTSIRGQPKNAEGEAGGEMIVAEESDNPEPKNSPFINISSALINCLGDGFSC